MKFRGVGITVWKGKAYLPCHQQYKDGTLVQADPVYVAALDEAELTSAVEKVLNSEIKVLPTPTKEEWKKKKKSSLSSHRSKKLAGIGA